MMIIYILSSESRGLVRLESVRVATRPFKPVAPFHSKSQTRKKVYLAIWLGRPKCIETKDSQGASNENNSGK